VKPTLSTYLMSSVTKDPSHPVFAVFRACGRNVPILKLVVIGGEVTAFLQLYLPPYLCAFPVVATKKKKEGKRSVPVRLTAPRRAPPFLGLAKPTPTESLTTLRWRKRTCSPGVRLSVKR